MALWCYHIFAEKRISPKEFHILEDDAPTVKKWAAEFKRVGETLKMTQDWDVLPRPPLKKTDRIHHMVMNDRRLTVNQIANVMSITRERVENILHKKLGM